MSWRIPISWEDISSPHNNQSFKFRCHSFRGGFFPIIVPAFRIPRSAIVLGATGYAVSSSDSSLPRNVGCLRLSASTLPTWAPGQLAKADDFAYQASLCSRIFNTPKQLSKLDSCTIESSYIAMFVNKKGLTVLYEAESPTVEYAKRPTAFRPSITMFTKSC